MYLPVVLAHGALGPFDELIFAAVGLLFLVIIGISWLRSRNAPDDDERDTSPPAEDAADPVTSEHFRLD